MGSEGLKVLRIQGLQGEPDVVECDGRSYLRRATFRPVFFEGDYLCSRCYGYVALGDAFCRSCGAAADIASDGCQSPASGAAPTASAEPGGNMLRAALAC